jgi:hypothetical protein
VVADKAERDALAGTGRIRARSVVIITGVPRFKQKQRIRGRKRIMAGGRRVSGLSIFSPDP